MSHVVSFVGLTASARDGGRGGPRELQPATTARARNAVVTGAARIWERQEALRLRERAADALRRLQEQPRRDVRAERERELKEQPGQERGGEQGVPAESAGVQRELEQLLDDERRRREERERPGGQVARRPAAGRVERGDPERDERDGAREREGERQPGRDSRGPLEQNAGVSLRVDDPVRERVRGLRCRAARAAGSAPKRGRASSAEGYLPRSRSNRLFGSGPAGGSGSGSVGLGAARVRSSAARPCVPAGPGLRRSSRPGATALPSPGQLRRFGSPPPGRLSGMCFDSDSVPPIPRDLRRRGLARRARARAPPTATGSPRSARCRRSRPRTGVVILPDVRGLYRFYEELALRFAERGYRRGRDRLLRAHGRRREARRRLRVHAARAADEAGARPGGRRARRSSTCAGSAAARSSPSASASAAATRGSPRRPATASTAPSASTACPAERNGVLGPAERASELEAPILALQAGDDQNITGRGQRAFEAALDRGRRRPRARRLRRRAAQLLRPQAGRVRRGLRGRLARTLAFIERLSVPDTAYAVSDPAVRFDELPERRERSVEAPDHERGVYEGEAAFPCRPRRDSYSRSSPRAATEAGFDGVPREDSDTR